MFNTKNFKKNLGFINVKILVNKKIIFYKSHNFNTDTKCIEKQLYSHYYLMI